MWRPVSPRPQRRARKRSGMAPLAMHLALILNVVVGGRAWKWPEVLQERLNNTSPHLRPSIKTFMNTSDPIWTYNTTMNINATCKVDAMVCITDTRIEFNRSFYYGGEKYGYRVEGTFFPEPIADPYAVLIGLPGGLKEGYELILYTSANYSCAVFHVTYVWGPHVVDYWFDLRVRNSSLEAGPTRDCLEFYQNFTKEYEKPSQGLYNTTCQRVLREPTKTLHTFADLLIT